MTNRKMIMLFGTGVLALTALLFWARATTPAHANPTYPTSKAALLPLAGRYVALPPTGNDAGNDCSNPTSPCATIQHAIDVAGADDVIHVAGGTYTRVGTVAAITKGLAIIGCYDPAFTTPDPDTYQTVLDAQWGGSVVSATNAGNVALQHLTLTHGSGAGNCGLDGCGGGIYARQSEIMVAQCTIVDNIGSTTDSGSGGGIYAYNSVGSLASAHVHNSRIVSNTASTSGSGFGGGLCIVAPSVDNPATIFGNVFENNTASANPVASGVGWGGGIYVNTGSVSLVENEILDNVGRTSWAGVGGGVYLRSVTSADVLTNVIRGNRATLSAGGGYGGGLFVDNSSAVHVAGNRIEGNWTSGHPTQGAGFGGGVYVMDSDVHLARNTIIGNSTGTSATAARAGGGVCIAYAPTTPVTLSNNLIVRNSASAYAGGGVYVGYDYPDSVSQALLVNNTIADNGTSGIVAYNYAVVTLTNNLVARHQVGLHSHNPASGTVSADTNLFWNGSDPITGSNAILDEPRLAPNYHPRTGSPALDAGLTIPWLTTDLDGNPRTPGAYDIGAFEGEEAWHDVYLPLVAKDYPLQMALIFDVILDTQSDVSKISRKPPCQVLASYPVAVQYNSPMWVANLR
ncbi:MAG: right-handed parallel beta-helix repeat-containing protein [Anaerolineae bacterium]|nr:right-handed parallel beta-helix repeat-containing protein [Anaerolineae bacterium]